MRVDLTNIFMITDDFIFKTKIDTVLKSINLSSEKYNYFHSLDLNSINRNDSLLIVDLENENLDFSYLKELKKTQKDKIFILGY